MVPDDPRLDCGHSDGGLLEGYAGYTVALCRAYLSQLRSGCPSGTPEVTVVPVPVGDRYAGLAADDPPFDILCGATTATVTLGASVPHSPYTFLTSTSALVNARFSEAQQQSCRVGVVTGTTSAPGMQDRVSRPRRLETWEVFTGRNPSCREDSLDRAREFRSTADAILALKETGAGGIDVLIDDHHILTWYWQNLDHLAGSIRLPDDLGSRYTALERQDGQEGAWSISAFRDTLQLIPAAISIEPYAVLGPPRSAALIADFSRFLTAEQQDRDSNYTQLLRRCFGRQVDRTFWFLMDFQSKVRDGNPLDLAPN
ncbi:hypothetical protein BYZ73_10680 [Rhodovulum viride]|uniref:Uncharacterized protein n=1 Tax=Rhodovulum viride TaxID=1231134 RepID=A0ABX9DGB5_9RHOB|nr:hypothetical protein [Rhodovulum viride]RAP41402.1 hypothetical protein BYZ73_10680 [Rhodovulum viride]